VFEFRDEGDRFKVVLERHAQTLLEQLPIRDDFVKRIRELIAAELAGGDSS